MLRTVFAGTPEFAVPALQATMCLTQVLAVYTQPDRPAGRGRKPRMSPVKAAALAAGVPVHQPERLREPQAVAALRALAPDLVVVVAYGLILPPEVLAIPRLGCINVHASLLPRWRGAAPIQRAVLAGDRRSGITIMQMDAGLDTGDILLQRPLDLAPRETSGSLHDRLAALGGEALDAALKALQGPGVTPVPQDPARVTYAPKIQRAEAEIDWRCSAGAIDRTVRAFDPWPVARTRWEGRDLRIWSAEPAADSDGAPGEVLRADAGGILVACGEGALRITRIQLPGGRPMTAEAFLAGHRFQGARLPS